MTRWAGDSPAGSGLVSGSAITLPNRRVCPLSYRADPRWRSDGVLSGRPVPSRRRVAPEGAAEPGQVARRGVLGQQGALVAGADHVVVAVVRPDRPARL